LNEDFADLLDRARAGEDSAWASLYRDLAPQIRGYLRARGAMEPDDLLGEVFLQVVRDLGSFSGGRREFGAWVFTIAQHRLLDDARHAKRHPSVPASDEVLEENLPTLDGAEHDALRSLSAEAVRGLVAGISPDQRSVLLLRVVGDLSLEEVARVTGKTLGAVKALQHRGLAAVKREMSPHAVSQGAPAALGGSDG